MVWSPPSLSGAKKQQVIQIVDDLDVFLKLHQVMDKSTRTLVPFAPLPMQQKIFDAYRAGFKRIICVKARQVAASTAAKMLLHWQLFRASDPVKYAIVSANAKSASDLLSEIHRWSDALAEQARIFDRPRATSNTTALKYSDTGAQITAYTARSKMSMRGTDPALIVLSEYGYAQNQAELLSQADAAAGDDGVIIIESTTANPNDLFSSLIRGAPENGWHLITMWWWEHPLYRDPIPDGWDDSSMTPDEINLQAKYGLDAGQICWRRRKIASYATAGEAMFRREYPGELDDCFEFMEGAYYSAQEMEHIAAVDGTLQHGGRTYHAPYPGDRYVVGVDTSGGVGGDYSALVVVSVATGQICYVERDNTTPPGTWAQRVLRIASRYHDAMILCEGNNHGHAVLLAMEMAGYTNLWRDPSSGKPWTTTMQSKLAAHAELRAHLQGITQMDRHLYLEMRGLIIPPGKLCPEAPPGAHDDLAMAAALAYRCLRDIPSSWRNVRRDPMTVMGDRLISRSRAKNIRSSYPI